jgi:hypothetical protein
MPAPLIADSIRPEVGNAKTRTVFEGAKTTTRTREMVKEARYLYKLRGGGAAPGISQGGYNAGGVSASKGTHDKDAMDDKIRLLTSSAKKDLWQQVNWEVGFAGWRRAFIKYVWPEHFHKVPKGGDLAPLAQDQVDDFHEGKNGLKSHKPYPGIKESGLADRTWEQYLHLRPTGNVALAAVQDAFRAGSLLVDGGQGTNDIQQIQHALNHFLGLDLAVDGKAGAQTKSAYADYQSRLYGIPKGSPDANGIPGADSLAHLGLTVWGKPA